MPEDFCQTVVKYDRECERKKWEHWPCYQHLGCSACRHCTKLWSSALVDLDSAVWEVVHGLPTKSTHRILKHWTIVAVIDWEVVASQMLWNSFYTKRKMTIKVVKHCQIARYLKHLQNILKIRLNCALLLKILYSEYNYAVFPWLDCMPHLSHTLE